MGLCVEYDNYKNMTNVEFLDAMSFMIKMIRLGTVLCLLVYLGVFVYESSLVGGSHTYMSIVEKTEWQSSMIGESYYAHSDHNLNMDVPLSKEEYKRVAVGDTLFITTGDLSMQGMRATLYHDGTPLFEDRSLSTARTVWGFILVLFTVSAFLPKHLMVRLERFHLYCLLHTYQYLTYGFLIYIGYMLGFI